MARDDDDAGAPGLSYWGWGRADRFPDAATRVQLGTQVAFLAGLDPAELPWLQEAREPVALADVRLRAPRVAVPAALAEFCTDATAARVRRTYGRSFRDILRGFRGDFSPAPDLVAQPRSEGDVVSTLAWAQEAGVAVIPRGGGTSVVGGVEADTHGTPALCLDLCRMDRVLEVDERSLAARIQAGATGPAIEGQLGERGLTLRHYPQSFEFATLGGFIATRSGGHFATVYTHIDEFVESLRTVTPAGVMESRRLPGSGAGPSPDRLMIGSEGILGVITEAWMRVRRRPRWRSTASVRFADFDAAVAATRALAQSGLNPSNCRLLDRREALVSGVDADGEHVLLIGFESADHSTEALMGHALALATDPAHGGRCEGGPRHRDRGEKSGASGDAGQWRDAFFEAPYMQTALISLGFVVDTFETACTWDRFPTLHAAVRTNMRAAIERTTGRRGHLACRFTHVYPDGPAPYYTFIAAPRGGPEESMEVWTELKRVACDTLIEHGATITHHHAVGRVHQPWYRRQRPELFARALAGARKALDPAGIMNPGVLLAADEIGVDAGVD